MARKDDRHAVRFPIRRATASEAAGARRMIESTFTDRISWTAAQVLLERCLPVIEQLSEQADVDTADLQEAIRHFLKRHPAPPRQVAARSSAASQMVFPGSPPEVEDFPETQADAMSRHDRADRG